MEEVNRAHLFLSVMEKIQPTQPTEERMDTNHINMNVPDHTSTHSEDVIEVLEIVAPSTEPVEAVESAPDMDTTTPKSQHVPLPERETDTT